MIYANDWVCNFRLHAKKEWKNFGAVDIFRRASVRYLLSIGYRRLQGAAFVAVRNQQTLINIIAADGHKNRTLQTSADKIIITYIGYGRPQGPRPAEPTEMHLSQNFMRRMILPYPKTAQKRFLIKRTQNVRE